MYSKVTDQIAIGDIATGVGADPTRTAYAKFNAHVHSQVSFPSYFQAGVAVGQEVNTTTDCSLVLFPLGTLVEQITQSTITLSKSALTNITDCVLTFSWTELGVVKSITVPGNSITLGSPVVTLTNITGFSSPSNLVDTTTISGFINNVDTTALYPICPYIETDSYLSSFSVIQRKATQNGTYNLVLRPEGAVNTSTDFNFLSVVAAKPDNITNFPHNSRRVFSTSDSTTPLLISKGSSLLIRAVGADGELNYMVTMIPIKRLTT